MKSIWLCLLLVLAPVAQAADPSPLAPPAASGRTLLLLNALEPQLTHSHLGVTAFGTYENAIDNGWQLDQWAAGRVSALLDGSGTRLVTVALPEARAKEIRDGDYLDGIVVKSKLDPGFAAWLSGEMAAHDADGALVLTSTRRQFAPNLYVYYAGYGVMSIHGKIPNRAFVFANVSLVPLLGDPPVPSRGVVPRHTDCRVRFDPASLGVESFETLTADALAPIRPDLERVMEKRLRQDLVAARLVAGEVERCEVENG